MNVIGEIRNARIDGTMLGPESHGIFTAYVYLDYGALSQGFGGYGLEEKYAHLFISRVLEIAGAETWEKLSGCYVRADADPGRVNGIGHALHDDWFYPSREWDDREAAS